MIAPYDQLLARVDGFQPVPAVHDGTTRAGRAFCPACDRNHRKRKLEIAESSHGGALLLKCRRGCSAFEIMESLGLRAADLFPKADHLAPAERNQIPHWWSAAGCAEAVAEAGYWLSMSPPGEVHARQIELQYAVLQFQSAAKSAMRSSSKGGAK